MVGVTRMVRKAGRRRGCGRNAYSRVMARAGRSVTVPGGRKLLFRKAPAYRSRRAGASAGPQTLIRSKDFSQACISDWTEAPTKRRHSSNERGLVSDLGICRTRRGDPR